MAKVLFTAIVADMRNKLNGTVFSKNRYGAYTRTKVTPVNPQSVAQTTVRARFAARAAAWRGLTDGQRFSWISGAAGFPITDIFGNSKILSGQALYGKLNLNLAQAGQVAITTLPVAVAVPSLVSIAVESDLSDNNIEIASPTAVIPAGFTGIVFATPLYGPGISFVKNKYRFITTIAAAGALNGADIRVQWGLINGPLVVGQKVSVKVFLVSNTTGQAGVPFTATTIVIA